MSVFTGAQQLSSGQRTALTRRPRAQTLLPRDKPGSYVETADPRHPQLLLRLAAQPLPARFPKMTRRFNRYADVPAAGVAGMARATCRRAAAALEMTYKL